MAKELAKQSEEASFKVNIKKTKILGNGEKKNIHLKDEIIK